MSDLKESIQKYIASQATAAGIPWRKSEQHLVEFQHADGRWVPPPDIIMKRVGETIVLGSWLGTAQRLLDQTQSEGLE